MDTLGKSWAPIIGTGIGSGTTLSVTQGKRLVVHSISVGSTTACVSALLAGTTTIARLYTPAGGSSYAELNKLCEKDQALTLYGNGAVAYVTVSYEER